MAATENGTMTLADARQIAAQAVMRLGSYDPTSPTDNYRLDAAIKAAGDEFTMKLFPVRKNFTYVMPANSRCVSFAVPSSAPTWVLNTSYVPGDFVTYSGKQYQCMVQNNGSVAPANDGASWALIVTVPSDFSCRRVRYAEIIDQATGRQMRQNIVDNETVKQYIWRAFGFVYSPNLVIPAAVGSAFFIEGLTAFDPENDQQWFYPVYTKPMNIALHYWQPFTSWTLGTATPSSVVLNIPDTMIMGILYYLVPQYFDMAQASNDYIKTCQDKMKAHYLSCTRALKGSSVQYGLPTVYGRDVYSGGM